MTRLKWNRRIDFGYGKSYTEFTIQTDHVEIEKSDVMFWVDVKNVGDELAGKEVIQVYVSAPGKDMEKPYQELVAFRKTSLLPPKAGECVLVRFPLASLASYSSKDAAWELEEGDYLIRVGNSSRNTQPVAVLRMKQSKKTSGSLKICLMRMIH